MSAGVDLRLGIDVGGTNTVAVILDRKGALVAKAKRLTSADVTAGITAAMDAVLAEPAVEPGRIKASYQWLDEQHETDWMRIATMMGGANRGSFMRKAARANASTPAA